MIDYQYGYLVGALLIALVWLMCWLWRKDLRQEMMFGSLLGLPFGLTEFFYVPEYWRPPTIFHLVEKFGFGIESLLFCFFAAGIATVVYEIAFNVKLRKTKNDPSTKGLILTFLPLTVLILIILLGETFYAAYSIYTLFVAGGVVALIIACLRRDLISQILMSGLFFCFLYGVLFTFFNHLFPVYVSMIFTNHNLWGVYFFGIPAEEYLFAASLGIAWSTLYEYMFRYKTVAKKHAAPLKITPRKRTSLRR